MGGAHGTRGWNRLRSDTEPGFGIFDFRVWTLRSAQGLQSFRVSADGRARGMLTVKLEGVDDRTAAARLSGAEICVPREQLPPTAPREFYRADLLGCRVVDEAGVELGVLAYFAETAAHPIMVIEGEREILLPATAKHLRKVDLLARTLVVRTFGENGNET